MKKAVLAVAAIFAVAIFSQTPKPGSSSGGSSLVAGADFAKPPLSDTRANIAAADCTSAETGRFGFASDYLGYVARCTGSAWAWLFQDQALTLPPTSGWTLRNGSGATLSTTAPQVVVTAPGAGVTDAIVYADRTAPATPYVIDVIATLMTDNGEAPSGSTSLIIGWSDATKIATCAVYPAFTGGMIASQKWTNSTTFSASYKTGIVMAPYAATTIHLRISDDGSNRGCTMLSPDHGTTISFHSVGRTDFLTPTTVLFGVSKRTASAAGSVIGILYSWSVT